MLGFLRLESALGVILVFVTRFCRFFANDVKGDEFNILKVVSLKTDFIINLRLKIKVKLKIKFKIKLRLKIKFPIRFNNRFSRVFRITFFFSK